MCMHADTSDYLFTFEALHLLYAVYCWFMFV
jgi:hypothetical protein